MASDPWGISGPAFSAWFPVALLVAVGLVPVLRFLLTRIGPIRADHRISPHAAAYLAGGLNRALASATTALVLAGRVHASHNGRLTRASGRERDRDPFEDAVWQTLLPRDQRKQQAAALRRHPALRALLRELSGWDLLLGPVRNAVARYAVGLPVAVWLVGVVRLVNGMVENRPTSILLIELFLSALVLGALARRTQAVREHYPSSLGVTTLRAMRAEYRSARPSPADVTGRWPAAVQAAVFGVAVLGVGVLPDPDVRGALLASGVAATGAFNSFLGESGRDGGGGGGCGGGGGGGCGGGCGG
jgi:uncharacterized protein (TIGR04222 family)